STRYLMACGTDAITYYYETKSTKMHSRAEDATRHVAGRSRPKGAPSVRISAARGRAITGEEDMEDRWARGAAGPADLDPPTEPGRRRGRGADRGPHRPRNGPHPESRLRARHSSRVVEQPWPRPHCRPHRHARRDVRATRSGGASRPDCRRGARRTRERRRRLARHPYGYRGDGAHVVRGRLPGLQQDRPGGARLHGGAHLPRVAGTGSPRFRARVAIAVARRVSRAAARSAGGGVRAAGAASGYARRPRGDA